VIESDLEEKLIAWVVQETSFDRSRVNLKSGLANDIGLDGDDAVEFMTRYAQAFNVDMTSFVFHDYFNNEAAWSPLAVVLAPFQKKEKKSLLISDLLDCAKTHTWRK